MLHDYRHFNTSNVTIQLRELQTIFGCGRNKIYQIVRTEEFPKIMIGKKIYIPINEFNEWKKKHIGAKV